MYLKTLVTWLYAALKLKKAFFYWSVRLKKIKIIGLWKMISAAL